MFITLTLDGGGGSSIDAILRWPEDKRLRYYGYCEEYNDLVKAKYASQGTTSTQYRTGES